MNQLDTTLLKQAADHCFALEKRTAEKEVKDGIPLEGLDRVLIELPPFLDPARNPEMGELLRFIAASRECITITASVHGDPELVWNGEGFHRIDKKGNLRRLVSHREAVETFVRTARGVGAPVSPDDFIPHLCASAGKLAGRVLARA